MDEVAVRLEREQRHRRVEGVSLVELQVRLDDHAELLAWIVDVMAELPEALHLAPGVVLGDREEDLLLRLEVLVEGRLRDPGALADGGDGGGLEALLAEQPQGRFEDAQLPLAVAPPAVSDRIGDRCQIVSLGRGRVGILGGSIHIDSLFFSHDLKDNSMSRRINL